MPLVVRLESDSVRSPKRKADTPFFAILFQLAHNGPKAALPVTKNIQETVSSHLLAFLDQAPHKNAVRIGTRPKQEKLIIWKYNDKLYIRTSHILMWPAWSAVVNGAGNVKCYEAPVTSRIMLSINDAMQGVELKPIPYNNGGKSHE